jgi:GDP-mannose transporter
MDKISADVLIGVGAYCICSSTMIIVNKAAMQQIPAAAFVNLCQMIFAIGTVFGLKHVFSVKVDEFESKKLSAYFIYSCGFAAGLFFNMKALAVSNIETIIVFRSCCPLVVAMAEYMYLGRAFPSIRSLSALLLILVGAMLYVYTDKEFAMSGISAYFWCFAYFLTICFQLTYGKYLITEIKMEMWTRVLYNQTLGIPITMFMGVAMNDFSKASTLTYSYTALSVLLLSCVMGVGISYAGFNCQVRRCLQTSSLELWITIFCAFRLLQRVVSGTSYALIGIMNKMLTIIINATIWDNHASNAGIASLLLCVFGGIMYQQPPLVVEKRVTEEQETKTALISSSDSKNGHSPGRSPRIQGHVPI